MKHLLDFEELKVSKMKKTKAFKVGVLLVREGQSVEDEFYSNSTCAACVYVCVRGSKNLLVRGSSEYEEFLQLLGPRVALQGFTAFAGGLDTGGCATGTHSIHTRWRESEIMFHVSTLLPLTANAQHIERKRHIGNDVVVLVFVDSSDGFNPKAISSHYNHVFIVISPERRSNGHLRYRVACVQKDGVPLFKPRIAFPGVFDHSPEFRAFLLDKCKALAHAPLPACLPA